MGWSSAFARSPRQRAGAAAEARAEDWLRQRGFVPVGRNFRCRGGEIDLVMQDGETLVFVEVRQRKDARFGGAAASVTSRKQLRIMCAAQYYLQRYRFPPPCRFDVVAFEGERIEWLRDAFRMA